MMNPLVSICITTYNHNDYILQAVNSVLMQKVTFAFEILLGEDDSTDGTKEKCIELARKYPDRIRLFLNNRSEVIHINGRPTGRFNFLNNLKNAKGKYIALLDGDDYWTDPFKLQKSIDFLEKNDAYSFTFHNCGIEEDGIMKSDFLNENTPPSIDLVYLAANGNCMRTLSVVFRNNFENIFLEWLKQTPVADFPIHVHNASIGKGKYFSETLGVYRKHAGGIWSTYKNAEMKMEWLVMIEEMSTHYPILNNPAVWQNQLAEVSFSIGRLFEREKDVRSAVYFEKSERYSPNRYRELSNVKLNEKKKKANPIFLFFKRIFK